MSGRFEVFADAQPWELQQIPSPIEERHEPTALELALSRTRSPSIGSHPTSPISPKSPTRLERQLSGDPESPPAPWKRRPSVKTQRSSSINSGYSATSPSHPSQYPSPPNAWYGPNHPPPQQSPPRRQHPPNLQMTRAGVAQRLMQENQQPRAQRPPPGAYGRRRAGTNPGSNRSSMASFDGMNSEELWNMDDQTPDMSNPTRPSQERPLDTAYRMSNRWDNVPLPETLWPHAPVDIQEYLPPPKTKSLTNVAGMKKRHTIRKSASRASTIDNNLAVTPMGQKELSSAHSSATDLSIHISKSQTSFASRPQSMVMSSYGFDLLSTLAPRDGGYAVAAQLSQNNTFSPTSSTGSDRGSFYGSPPPNAYRNSRGPPTPAMARYDDDLSPPLPGRMSTHTTSSNLSTYSQDEALDGTVPSLSTAAMTQPTTKSPLSQHTTAAEFASMHAPPMTPVNEDQPQLQRNNMPAPIPVNGNGNGNGSLAPPPGGAALVKKKTKKELKAEEKAKAKAAKLEAKAEAQRKEDEKIRATQEAAKTRTAAAKEAARLKEEEKAKAKAAKASKRQSFFSFSNRSASNTASATAAAAAASAASAPPVPSSSNLHPSAAAPRPSQQRSPSQPGAAPVQQQRTAPTPQAPLPQAPQAQAPLPIVPAPSAPAVATLATVPMEETRIPNGIPNGAPMGSNGQPIGHGPPPPVIVPPRSSSNRFVSQPESAPHVPVAAGAAMAAGVAAVTGATVAAVAPPSPSRPTPSPQSSHLRAAPPSPLPAQNLSQQSTPVSTAPASTNASPSVSSAALASSRARTPSATSMTPSSASRTPTAGTDSGSATSTAPKPKKSGLFSGLRKRFSMVALEPTATPQKPRPASMAVPNQQQNLQRPNVTAPPAPVHSTPQSSRAVPTHVTPEPTSSLPPTPPSKDMPTAGTKTAPGKPMTRSIPIPPPVIVPPRQSSLARGPEQQQPELEDSDHQRQASLSDPSSVVVTPTTSMATNSSPSLFEMRPVAVRADSAASGSEADYESAISDASGIGKPAVSTMEAPAIHSVAAH